MRHRQRVKRLQKHRYQNDARTWWLRTTGAGRAILRVEAAGALVFRLFQEALE
jgi:hypothetical protein